MEDALAKFEKKLATYSTKEKAVIIDAARWARQKHEEQKRASGEPFFIHPLKVAEFLVDLGMDYETVTAALLHDILEDTLTTDAELRKRFDKTIFNLVDGVTKISIAKAKNKSIQQTESFRKMMIATAEDVRVIIIKLADRLHNLQTLEHLPEHKRKRIANETLEIYAPLADRLGISGFKETLESLSLKHLKPEAYKQLSETLFLAQKGNISYLKKVERNVLKTAQKEGIHIEVKSRAKHIYSVYLKMKKRKKSIDEINDLLGIRILCNTTNDCYTLLGIVHKLWKPIENRFKDYIAMPKANNYQSLHTTVMGEKGRHLEFQIRTFSMHNIAEYGVAAHWIYKEKSSGKSIKPENIAVINKLRNWNKQDISQIEFWEEIKSDFLKDSIFVYTPQGHIVELAKGSTAIDFAYHIHTEIGHHCVGAKADGVIIPLNTPLKNTQVIEILKSNNTKPNVNWLRFVKTSKAKNKIRHWVNKNTEDFIIAKNVIAKNNLKQMLETDKKEKEIGKKTGNIIKRFVDTSKKGFKIGEEKNMMINFANCCKPETGDDIIGYVSRGRGIIVHKKDCHNLKNINEFAERSIPVEWEAVSPRSSRRFEVTSKITNDLFSEIEGAIRNHGGHLIEGRLEENDKGNLKGNFTMEMTKQVDYSQILKKIRNIPSVLNIRPLS